MPAWVPDSLETTYLNAKDSWQSLPDTNRVLHSIIAANVGVALLWRTPSLQVLLLLSLSTGPCLLDELISAALIGLCAPQGFMLRNFTLQLPPQSARPWTFLTSNFSHAGTLHLGVNMLALSSFGSVVAEVCQ